MSIAAIYVQGLRVGAQDFARTWTWKSWLFGWMLRAGTTLAMWAMLGRLLGSQQTLDYLVIGNAVMAGPMATAWVTGTVQADRRDGIYPLQVVAPASLLPAIVGRSSIWLLNGVASAAATFVLLGLAFGLRVTPADALVLAPLVVLICATSTCLMLFFSAVVTLEPRLGNAAFGGSITLLMALCGVAVPVAFWPPATQAVANVLPVTHGLAAIRVLLAGGPAATVLIQTLLEAATGAGWLLLALLTVDRMAETGRASGSIDFS